jgi:hypothetical protein
MDHTRLGPLLMKRLQSVLSDNPDVVDQLIEFVEVTEGTVHRWKSIPEQYPRGATLNKLWYFLEAVGVSSPELGKLPEFGGYVGKLMAFGVISMPEALEYCGLANEQGVLRTIRGEQTPSNPSVTLDDLRDTYEDKLNDAMRGLRTVLGTETTQVRFIAPNSSPPEGAEASEEFLVELAATICSLYPKLQYAQKLSPQQQAHIRELVGLEVLFKSSTLFNRLCSNRANIEGENF